MQTFPERLYFATCALDLKLWELRRDGRPVDLAPKPMSVLLYLIENRDRVVSKSELFEQLWPGLAVSECTLAAALKTVRRAIGDDGRTQWIISTRRGYGFRFIAPVEADAAAA